MKTVNAVHLSDIDNCVTLTGPADAGDAICFTENKTNMTVIARANVPIWHKIAITPIKRGAVIYKYGAGIGLAVENIEPGDHVHIHNIRSPIRDERGIER